MDGTLLNSDGIVSRENVETVGESHRLGIGCYFGNRTIGHSSQEIYKTAEDQTAGNFVQWSSFEIAKGGKANF